LNLSATSLRITSPKGLEIDGTLEILLPDKVRYIPLAETTEQGTYTIRVQVEDSLGNKPAEPYPVTFNIGEASSGPSLVITTPDPEIFLSSVLPERPWVFTATVSDNSGTGINVGASRLELYSSAADTMIAGNSTADAQGNLSFEATQIVATDGSLDGEFELRIIAEDNDPTSGTLVTSVSYYYDTRRPDTLAVSADSLLVAVTLADPSPGSGIDLLTSSIQVSYQGAPVASASYSDNGDSTLFAEFDPPLRNTGSYTIDITCTDRAENTRTRTKSFFISAGVLVTNLVPGEGSIISRSLAESRTVATVTIEDHSGTGIDSSATYITLVDPEGDTLSGVSAVDNQGQVTFTLEQFLAVDGTDDGRYTMHFDADDNDPETEPFSASFTFLYDTQAPDTLTLSFYGTSRIDSAAVTITDENPLPSREFSGINTSTEATYFNILSPNGETMEGTPTVLEKIGNQYRLTRHFDPPLTEQGTYTAQLVMEDHAGNLRERQKQYDLWVLADAPQLVSMDPAGASAINSSVEQPLTVTVLVDDPGGSGINLNASTVQVLNPDLQPVGGTAEKTEGEPSSLVFTFSSLLSTDGSDDGIYWVVLHVEDQNPESADLDTTLSFIYDNKPPDTTAVIYAPDTSYIQILFDDPPAVTDRAGSGVNILSALVQVIDPDGAEVPIELTHNGVNTVTVSFTGGKPSLSGSYTVEITAEDKAGNQLVKSFSFTLNVGGRIIIYPPDSSIVIGPLVRITAVAGDSAGLLTPGGDALLRVTHQGLGVLGTSTVQGDTLVFTLNDTLPTDGRSDGRYVVAVEMGIAALGAGSNRSAFFVFDNLPPDTASVEIVQSTDEILVKAEFADGGSYPDVAGIDPLETSVVFEDPNGVRLDPINTLWLDNKNLEARFNTFEKVGMHDLILKITDRGGLSSTRIRGVINTAGVSDGGPVAFVEEVPARTSANITFIAGRAGSRITKAVLRIFNLRGDLVRRVDVSDRIDGAGSAVNAEWLLDNDRGNLVMNGVFIYYWEITYSDGRVDRVRKTLAVAR
jgi:Bacterial Ig-like domain